MTMVIDTSTFSQPDNLADFIFEAYAFDRTSGVLSLHYRYADGDKFCEKIQFPLPFSHLTPASETALDHAFRLIFLLSGISYFKAWLSPRLRCEAFTLPVELANFLQTIYVAGLGEFSVQNKLHIVDFFRFDFDRNAHFNPQVLTLSHRHLVPMGGGKDSLVTLDLLQKNNQQVVLFQSGNAETITRVVKETNLDVIKCQRHIDPALFILNEQKGAYNGHVPITAILSSITIACAILYDFDTIVFSNEHSASEGNMMIGDRVINHQYSKSFEMEVALQNIITCMISPNIKLFSLLRPLSETAIVERFSRQTPYHSVFMSCNKTMKVQAHHRLSHWCCHCPKCQFIFLSLAAFIDKEHLIKIFGHNLLDDESQIADFSALLGLATAKPFECVGTLQESQQLLAYLALKEEWKTCRIIKALAPAVTFNPAVWKSLFDLKIPHNVAEPYLRYLQESQPCQ